MKNIERYKTAGDFNETTFKEKGSVFIAQVYPVENEDDAIKILEKSRKKYYDATHHCYAYKLLGDQIKYSDDGEPNGTAGLRILNAINHSNLNKILVLVIRYFGGIKLGIGPLGKAYYKSALQTLESCTIIEKTGYKKISLTANLTQINNIYHLIDQYKGRTYKSDYTNDFKLECLISADKSEKFIMDIKEKSKGKVIINEDTDIVFL